MLQHIFLPNELGLNDLISSILALESAITPVKSSS